MKKIAIIAVLPSFFSSISMAAPIGKLVYAPLNPPAGIPTLSNLMIILLSVLLVIAGMRLTKKNNKAGKLFVTLLGVTVLMAGIVSGNFVAKVNAVVINTPLSNPTGGTVDVFGDSENYYENTSGVIQKIISIDLPDRCGGDTGVDLSERSAVASSSTPMCTVGMQLAPSGTCEIDCRTLFEDSL